MEIRKSVHNKNHTQGWNISNISDNNLCSGDHPFPCTACAVHNTNSTPHQYFKLQQMSMKKRSFYFLCWNYKMSHPSMNNDKTDIAEVEENTVESLYDIWFNLTSQTPAISGLTSKYSHHASLKVFQSFQRKLLR